MSFLSLSIRETSRNECVCEYRYDYQLIVSANTSKEVTNTKITKQNIRLILGQEH